MGVNILCGAGWKPLGGGKGGGGLPSMECRKSCQCFTLHHQPPKREPYVWCKSCLIKVAVTPHNWFMAGSLMLLWGTLGRLWGGGGGWHVRSLCTAIAGGVEDTAQQGLGWRI